jgi:hypothetical protein
LLKRLLENDPAVTSLLERNPFAGHAPSYVRALFYEYRYAPAGSLPKGRWWNRRLVGVYFPTVQLRPR